MAIQQLQRVVIYADALASIEADEAALAEVVFGIDTDDDTLYYSLDDGATWTQVGSGTVYYQTIRDNGAAETQRGKLNFLSGTGVSASVADDAGNDESEVTHSLNFSALTEDTDPDATADFVATYDANTAGHKKVLLQNVPSSMRMMFSQTADKTVADTAVETTLVGSGRGTASLTANQPTVGTQLVIRAAGYLSDTGTPTLNVKATLGGSTVCSTGAITLASGVSNVGWVLEVTITFRTLGASGTVVATGLFHYNDGTQKHLIKTTTTTADTTGSLQLDFTATWGTASASNTITAQTVGFFIFKPSPTGSTGGDVLLLESGSPDNLLLESGDAVLVE